MPTGALSLALLVIQEAAKYAPTLIADLQALFGQATITDSDWAALHDKVKGESYNSFVPGSDLPPTAGGGSVV